MDIRTLLARYHNYPLPHQLLANLLASYQNPNDKIYRWLKEGWLIQLKRGLYIWDDPMLQTQLEPFVISNTLYGPSYISCESALAYYGLIPEQVFSVTAMTFKSSKKFENKLGTFEYIKVPKAIYPYGIKRIELREAQFTQMAIPEKALLDKIITTPNLLFRSEKAAKEFLLENMRMEEGQLRRFQTELLKSWLDFTPKKESIRYLIQMIKKL